MFGWNRGMENTIRDLGDKVNDHRRDYWELRDKYNRLLKHLGLTEKVVKEHTIFKKIKKT